MKEVIVLPKNLSKTHGIDTLQIMYAARFIDDKMEKLVKQNKGTTFFLSTRGHEIIGACASLLLKKGTDWALPYYRDRAFAIGFGCPLVDIFAAFLARDIPHHSGGRMMLDHFSDKTRKMPCQSSCVGSQFLQAVGVAKGIQLRGQQEVVYVSAGDGATSQGDFHEALNFSCIHRLPIVFVVQDNRFAISTPALEQTAGAAISSMVQGYQGLSIFSMEGKEYEALSSALFEATLKAREDQGPSLVVVKVPRLAPHTISDDPKKYKDEELVLEEQKQDPLIHLERWLLEKSDVTLKNLEELQLQIRQRVEEAAASAESLVFPKKESATSKVFFPFTVEEKKYAASEENITILDAVNRALKEEMQQNAGVLVFGQDVAREKGGVFGATKGLTKKFGRDRCFNTPLAESTIIGLAIGLSFDGYHRPVAEIQFSDYVWTGMNQLVNELASIYYRSNGEWNCPVVIRMTCGGYVQGGPYHSQSIEAVFAHIPGIKVVMPSNAADAKRLLKTAIRDPNPVIFLEHKALYRERGFCARKEPSKEALLPFGKASIVKQGKELTLVCWGMMVVMADAVVKEMDVDVEIIDLRTLQPLDLETILTSVEKTNKLLIVHEACEYGGFGAEIAAQVIDKGFLHLDAPIKRVAAKNCPIPYCKILEDAVLPQKEEIKKAIIELVSF